MPVQEGWFFICAKVKVYLSHSFGKRVYTCTDASHSWTCMMCGKYMIRPETSKGEAMQLHLSPDRDNSLILFDTKRAALGAIQSPYHYVHWTSAIATETVQLWSQFSGCLCLCTHKVSSKMVLSDLMWPLSHSLVAMCALIWLVLQPHYSCSDQARPTLARYCAAQSSGICMYVCWYVCIL